MAAATYDVIIDQGDDWRRVLEWVDDTGAPLPLHATLPAESEIRDTDNVLIGTPSITVDGAAGRISLALDDTVTSNMRPGVHRWDLFVHDENGDRRRLVAGKAVVRRKVTL